MNTKRFFKISGLLIYVILFTTFIFPQNTSNLPQIRYKEYKLKNGLRVFLHQDKSTPIVAVNVWYHVGSKNEVPGKTGFAHLFEHLMFKGSKHFNAEYSSAFEKVGASVNGATGLDITNYYEVVPSNFLELALWLESDRMGFLLDVLTKEKFDNQRDIVKNERRQRYDNRPYGIALEKIHSLIYPRDHPYHWRPIGSMADLSAASIKDAQAFYQKYYVPNNASIAIVGDFDEKQTIEWIEKYFGSIPKGSTKIKRPNPLMPRIDGTIRYQMEDAVKFPRLYMVWHTPKNYHKDAAALRILSTILTSGRNSRLQKSLVHDKQLALDVISFNFAEELSGIFYLSSTANPDQTIKTIEEEILAEIERIKKTPPTAEEMERAINNIESYAVFDLETVLSKAYQLNAYATFVGTPNYFQADLDRFLNVTAADVQRVARKYLTDNHLVMNILPGQKKSSSEQPTRRNLSDIQNSDTGIDKSKSEKPPTENWRYEQPEGGATPEFTLPEIKKSELNNGLEVWFVQRTNLPIISLNMIFKSGSDSDPLEKSGLSDFSSSLIDQGTKTRSAEKIADEFESIGASFSSVNNFDSSRISVQTLTKHFDKALDVFADVIQNPIFPNNEISSYRSRRLNSLLQSRDNPDTIAELVFNKILYPGDHPYGIFPDEKSIKNITRDDLIKYHKTVYQPNDATLIVVGDINTKTLLTKLNSQFAEWKAGKTEKSRKIPVAKKHQTNPKIYLVDKPGAAQSVIKIGQVGVSRNSVDYYPLLVMNQILGGQFTSRVNMNLREDKGYTYGASTKFNFRRSAGPFVADTSVQTEVTKEAVLELLKELNGVRREIPISENEIGFAKQSLIQGFPSSFETINQVARKLSDLAIYELPKTYIDNHIQKINAVSINDVYRVANKYLEPNDMVIVIVGDRNVIESKLKEIEDIGQSIIQVDVKGNLLN